MTASHRSGRSTARAGRLTIPAIRRLARRYCPVQARWGRLFATDAPAWGPAHEIGHALLSSPRARSLESYGLCAPLMCRCAGERCLVVELAAMYISAKLHLAADRQDLIETEISATEDYNTISMPWHWARATRLLEGLRLVRLPRTVEGLEGLLKKRVPSLLASHLPASKRCPAVVTLT